MKTKTASEIIGDMIDSPVLQAMVSAERRFAGLPTEQLLYIMRGLPGSGKSSMAKNIILADPEIVEVNRDDLRKLEPGYIRGKFNSKFERIIKKKRDELISEALKSGRTVVCSDTNLSENTCKDLCNLAESYGASVKIISFMEEGSPYFASVNTCIKRDLQREESVGKDVILRMWYQYHGLPKNSPIEPRECPSAVICDLDGTLCHHEGRRSPYDPLYNLDTVDHALLHLFSFLNPDLHLLLVSGREGTEAGRRLTLEWLQANNVKYAHLFMRTEGDFRDDAIVKKEIFQNHIKGNFNVFCVFDDRPKVCRMWELEGLKVFRCGPEFDFDISKS